MQHAQEYVKLGVRGTHHAGRVAAVELLLLLLERRRRGRLLPLLLLVRAAQRACGRPAEALRPRRSPHPCRTKQSARGIIPWWEARDFHGPLTSHIHGA